VEGGILSLDLLIIYSGPFVEGKKVLTLSPPNTIIVPYSNSLDPDETPSNLASHPDPTCLTLGQHFHPFLATLKHFEH